MGENIYTDIIINDKNIYFTETILGDELYLLNEKSMIKGSIRNNCLDLKQIIASNEMIISDKNKYILVTRENKIIKTKEIDTIYNYCKSLSIKTDRYNYYLDIASNYENNIEITIKRIYAENTPSINISEMHIKDGHFIVNVEKENCRFIDEAGILLFNNEGKIVGVTCTNAEGNKALFEINLEDIMKHSKSLFSSTLILDGHILPIKLGNNATFDTYISKENILSAATVKSDSDNNLYIDTRFNIQINPTIETINYYDSELLINGKLNSSIPYYKSEQFTINLSIESMNNKTLDLGKVEINNGLFSIKLNSDHIQEIRDNSIEYWQMSMSVKTDKCNITSALVKNNAFSCEEIYEQPVFNKDNVSTLIITTNTDNTVNIRVINKVNIAGITSIIINNKKVRFKFKLDTQKCDLDKTKKIKVRLSTNGKKVKHIQTKITKDHYALCTYKTEDMNEFIKSILKDGITTSTTIDGLKYEQNITDISAMSINKNLIEAFNNCRTVKKIKRTLYKKVFNKLPASPKKVVFESFLGRNVSGNPKYIYDYMVSEGLDTEYKMYWVVNDLNEKIEGKHTKIKRKSLRYYYHMATSGNWVFNSRQPNEIVKRKKNRYLQTWHGTPLKRLANDMTSVDMAGNTSIKEYQENFYKNSRRWDYLLAQNEYSEQIFKRAFNFNKEIIKGYPANDVLYNKNNIEDIKKIKNKLGIPNDKKVLLYAPTWRDNSFYKKGQYKLDINLDIEKLREALSDEYILLIKAHYLIADDIDTSKYENFAYDLSKGVDIQELYLISDIMITDYSSTMFDYANLKRPMVFFAYDIEDYRDTLRGFYLDFEKIAPGPIVKTTQDVIDSIKNISEVEEIYSEKYEEFYKTYCNIDNGNSAKQVVERFFNINDKRKENADNIDTISTGLLEASDNQTDSEQPTKETSINNETSNEKAIDTEKIVDKANVDNNCEHDLVEDNIEQRGTNDESKKDS